MWLLIKCRVVFGGNASHEGTANVGQNEQKCMSTGRETLDFSIVYHTQHRIPQNSKTKTCVCCYYFMMMIERYMREKYRVESISQCMIRGKQ